MEERERSRIAKSGDAVGGRSRLNDESAPPEEEPTEIPKDVGSIEGVEAERDGSRGEPDPGDGDEAYDVEARKERPAPRRASFADEPDAFRWEGEGGDDDTNTLRNAIARSLRLLRRIGSWIADRFVGLYRTVRTKLASDPEDGDDPTPYKKEAKKQRVKRAKPSYEPPPEIDGDLYEYVFTPKSTSDGPAPDLGEPVAGGSESEARPAIAPLDIADSLTGDEAEDISPRRSKRAKRITSDDYDDLPPD